MKEFIPGTNEPNPNQNDGENLIHEANQILSNGKVEKHKKKKAEKRRERTEKDRSIEKRLRQVYINPETLEVEIKFHEVITIAPEDEDGESSVITNKYSVKSERRPSKDFVSAMKSLRKYALELAEINDSTESNYSVSTVKIDGDMLMKQSRASITLAKYIERTGKVIQIKLGQVTMYGESEYHNLTKFTNLIEKLEERAWAYLSGEYEEDIPNQLPLFR